MYRDWSVCSVVPGKGNTPLPTRAVVVAAVESGSSLVVGTECAIFPPKLHGKDWKARYTERLALANPCAYTHAHAHVMHPTRPSSTRGTESEAPHRQGDRARSPERRKRSYESHDGSFGRYMAQKSLKYDEQFRRRFGPVAAQLPAHLRSSHAHSSSSSSTLFSAQPPRSSTATAHRRHRQARTIQQLPPQIFRGVCVYIDGDTSPPSMQLQRLLGAHGGIAVQYNSTSRVTHRIANNLPHAKLMVRRFVYVIVSE
jgi:hypothetical protein